MSGYAELTALPPEAFLAWENFRTCCDAIPSNIARQEQDYVRGLSLGQESSEVGIAASGTWYARGTDGRTTTSYEGVGYHANTAYFWKGVLASGCRIVIHRFGGKSYCIKDLRQSDLSLTTLDQSL